MPTIELTEDEAVLLAEIAEARLSELRREIHHTDRPSYRDGLKRREALLEALVSRLAAAVPAAPRR